MNGDITGDILTVSEAADILKVAENTIRSKIRQGCDWGTYIQLYNDDGTRRQPIFRVSRSAMRKSLWQLFPDQEPEMANV